MTNKELYYFTGHCLSLDEHPEFREKVIEMFTDAKDSISFLKDGIPGPPEENDLENFIQLCSDHLIIPAIYLKLKAHDILAYLPEDFIQALKEIYDLNRERNQQILQQIDDITAVLDKENIQPVFLKGTANLLDGLYSDMGERMIGDIDFLVKEDDFIKTAAILEGIGYQHETLIYTDFKSRKHYPSLSKKGEIAAVEIHRLPVRREHTAKFSAQVVLRDKKVVPGKPGMYVPSDNHKLIHTFIHSQLDDWGHAYKQSSFRSFYDLYLLSKSIEVSALVDQTGYRRKAIFWLIFGQRVLGMKGKIYPVIPISAKWFCFKYDISFSFPSLYAHYTVVKKIINLLGQRYAGTFMIAFSSPKGRRYMYKKLSCSEWYSGYFR